MSHQRRKDPLVWGLILIAVGALFFLEKFDIRIWDTVWRLWPLILIVWGGLKVYNGLQEKKESRDGTGRAPQAKP
ncbi:MAG: DUF5668 domain-containing protein [Candidatus Aminicenantes bacterium]|jgi:uncharacterized membrane protein (UPF0136 family)|nr:DUF5668 domain-containing protein [Candidatus Aminicenantes bacterium]